MISACPRSSGPSRARLRRIDLRRIELRRSRLWWRSCAASATGSAIAALGTALVAAFSAVLSGVLTATFSAALASTLLLVAAPASAHELTIAEMNLREFSPGRFYYSWAPGGLGNDPATELSPQWPADCSIPEPGLLQCEGGLRGRVAIDGVGASYSAAMLRMIWLDGQRRVYTVTKAQPELQFFGGANDMRGRGEIVYAYFALGIEHILGGIDHLLFVVCLLYLVGFNRQLLWTITAFTVAHSITLALSSLGLLTLRGPPVEATIALSIVLAASEALRTRPTATRRWPAAVAFVFGLVHGLGFAGALQEIGLPEHQLPVALLTFNLGVEAGQLMVVLLAWLIYKLLGANRYAIATRTPAIYAIGALAAFWSWQRLAIIALP